MRSQFPRPMTVAPAHLDELQPPIRGLILDMDGVLWKEDEPIGDLAGIFGDIKRRGLGVVAATNNATNTVDEYLIKLRGFGVSLEPWQIVTAAEATALTLRRDFPDRGQVFVVGEHGVVDALSQAGFEVITDPADEHAVIAVVAGWDRGLTYDKLRTANLHIRAGAAYYGTNADATFPTPAGLIPGAGPTLAALSMASEREPFIIGKPSPLMMQIAAERMKLTKDDVLAVGDRLATDIAGGQAFGARTAVVLSGVTSAEQAAAWRPLPNLIAANLQEILQH